MYDGLGQRVQTTANGETRHLVYDIAGQLIAEYRAPTYSLSVNGAGAYVNVPTSTSLNLTGAYTLEAWIKTNSNSTQQGIIERYSGSQNLDSETCYVKVVRDTMRKQYSAAYKAKFVLALLKEHKSLSQLAAEHKVHLTQLRQWCEAVLHVNK